MSALLLILLSAVLISHFALTQVPALRPFASVNPFDDALGLPQRQTAAAGSEAHCRGRRNVDSRGHPLDRSLEPRLMGSNTLSSVSTYVTQTTPRRVTVGLISQSLLAHM